MVRSRHFLPVLFFHPVPGLPRNLWKLAQQLGRVGRDPGSQAVSVTMHWPGQKGLQGTFFQIDIIILQFQGKSSPAARVREVFAERDQRRRKAVNSAFSLTDFNGNLYSLTLKTRLTK